MEKVSVLKNRIKTRLEKIKNISLRLDNVGLELVLDELSPVDVENMARQILKSIDEIMINLNKIEERRAAE